LPLTSYAHHLGKQLLCRPDTRSDLTPPRDSTYNEQFEQILPGFFSQGIEIPSPDAEGVAQKATHTQSSLLTRPTTTAVEQVPARFGLVDNSPDRWKKLRAKIIEINSTLQPRGEDDSTVSRDAQSTSECKLLLLVRHGEGFRTSFITSPPVQHR
jgi:hypothetical protein